jgi:hypothetical protein
MLSDEQLRAIKRKLDAEPKRWPFALANDLAFARAAIEADRAERDGWKPIETAPKDGTRIILGNPHGAWMGEYRPVYQSGYRPDDPWFSVMLNRDHMGRFPSSNPTNWMPLPAAPAKEQP